ncbi:MAG: twin-arginine translocation pathway signal protein, partial [SAR86 cluster bacterium]|nr:twin-arginine translocation pathway signal protein [SAR86 cluster bacterium]
MVSRRDFLKITGGGFILSAAALGGFIGTRTPHKALIPWLNAGQYEDLRLKALSYAILSPN